MRTRNKIAHLHLPEEEIATTAPTVRTMVLEMTSPTNYTDLTPGLAAEARERVCSDRSMTL